MSKTTPLYLRLPTELKDEVDRMAIASDQSLTVAVAHLVDVGIRNTDGEVARLRERISALEGQLTELRDERDALRSDLGQVREEIARNRTLIESVLQRLSLPVGTCPTCNVPVTGAQVFVDGACLNRHNLQTSAVALPPKSTLNQSELLAALAVVGIALGIAVMVSKS